MMVHTAKIKLQDEFKRFKKKIETDKRIKIAKTESANRVELLKERERSMNEVKEATLNELEKVVNDKAKYKKLLRNLIVQGLIKLNESKITIHCRQDDVKLVEEISDDCISQYKTLIEAEANDIVNCELSVKGSETQLSGGVKLLAYHDKIICDNTLASRVNIGFDQMMPDLRKTLFTQA